MATILKSGSSGSLVKTLQELLNSHGKLAASIAEDGAFGDETEAAVCSFQKGAGLRVDGKVGAETAKALADRAGTKAKSFAASFGIQVDGPVTEDANTEELVELTIGSRTGSLTRREFDRFRGQMREVLRKVLTAARIRAASAREVHDHFLELEADQTVVAWCVQLLGPKLPPASTIAAAESAVSALESSLGGNDFDKIASAIEEAERAVNKAATEMGAYQKAVIGRTEGWITALTFTKEASFEVVKGIAKFQLRGNATAAPLVDAAAAAVDRASTEFGKFLAGTGEGAGKAVLRMVIDASVAGGIGAIFKDKGKVKFLLREAGGKLARLVAKGWLARAEKAVESFTMKWFEKVGQKVLETAFTHAGRLLTRETSLEAFAADLAKALATSIPLAGLDVWLDRKFQGYVCNLVEKMPRLPEFFRESEIGMEILKKELTSTSATKLVESAVGVVLEQAKGDETAEELGQSVARTVVGSSEFRSLVDAVAKKAKKK